MLRKVFWDRETGSVIYTSSWMGDFEETTFDQDYEKYKFLNERVKETIKMKVYKEGEYEEDFANCTSVRMNLETETPEFSYPDPNEPEVPSVFQQPLTEQVKALEAENVELKKLIEQIDRENKNAIFEIYTMLGG